MLRAALIVAGGCAALVLGTVQFVSMAFYGDLSRPPALPACIAPGWGAALARPLGSHRVPAVVRAAYAQALLHRGDVAAAAAVVAGLAEGPRSADLRGQLAELAGDPAGALPLYARARDYERAQRLIDADAAAGRFAQAARLEDHLTDVLGGAADAGVRARALWRSGQLAQAEATTVASDPRPLERRSLAYYERALALAPNEETYLLAAGQQALTLGDRAAAERYYARALDAVPNSADARAGLVRARL